MKCEKCGRQLKTGEKKFCPHCKNERDKNIKKGVEIGGGTLAVLATIGLALLKIFGGSKDNKS
jgi:ABC-type ATPase with predicted acetyltransferase domain